jgi:hypothetical protein
MLEDDEITYHKQCIDGLAIIGSRHLEVGVVSMRVRLSDPEIRPPGPPLAQPQSHGLCTARLQYSEVAVQRPQTPKRRVIVCLYFCSLLSQNYITSPKSSLFLFYSASDHHLLSYHLIHFLFLSSLKSFNLFQSLIHFQHLHK